MGKVIGIDLGTTNSAVAIIENGEPKIIANSEGGRTTPSIIAFMDGGERKVGASAKRQSVTNPKKTVHSIKRFMGQSFKQAKEESAHMPYEIVEGENGLASVKIDDKKYTPQEISAIILQKMKKTAEDYLGQEVTDAVITVPAYFNDSQRQATKEAGAIAGLNVLRIVNEPTAAALAYGLGKDDTKADDEKYVIVFDCGGGTHDVSVMELSDGVFTVKSTNGDTHLGGDDFDRAIIDWLVEEFKKENAGFDLTKDPMALQRLREAAEKAKVELSSSVETEINLPYITAIDGAPVHMVKKMTRTDFNKLVQTLVERTIDPCDKALKDAGLKKGQISEVILVGGTTRIPAIREAVKEYFGKEPNHSVNPDEVVALGAAVQGGILSNEVEDVVLLDVTPLSLGIETMGGVFTKLIEANTTIPTKRTEVFSTAADNQPSVEIHVLQGERPMAKDNKTIGRFHLDGIPPAPRGVPKIEVSFDIDSDGILQVFAKDEGTGKEHKIRIEASSGLSDKDIEKMKEEAEAHAEEDKKRLETQQKLNAADQLVFQTEKNLKEYGDKISSEKSDSIRKTLMELKNAHQAQNVEKVDELVGELNTKWGEVASDIYATNGEKEQTNEESKVKDVDFEEVK